MGAHGFHHFGAGPIGVGPLGQARQGLTAEIRRSATIKRLA